MTYITLQVKFDASTGSVSSSANSEPWQCQANAARSNIFCLQGAELSFSWEPELSSEIPCKHAGDTFTWFSGFFLFVFILTRTAGIGHTNSVLTMKLD